MIKLLDAWAVLAWLKGEGPPARKVRKLLLSAKRGELSLIMSIINLGEVYYRIASLYNEERAKSILDVFRLSPVSIISVEDRLVFEAASLKARLRISYVDAFATALALERGAVLVTGDPDFRELEKGKILKIEWL